MTLDPIWQPSYAPRITSARGPKITAVEVEDGETMKTINELLAELSASQVQGIVGREVTDVKRIGRAQYSFNAVSFRHGAPVFESYEVQFYVVGCEIKHRLIAATSMRAA